MKNKAKRNSENKSIDDHPLPVEEFARLVEGLDASDIEAACVRDGAAPGGVPPAWNSDALITALDQRAAEVRASDQASRLEWAIYPSEPVGQTCESPPRLVIAHGHELASLGIEDGATLEAHGDLIPREGDLVIAEIAGLGRFLRCLRLIGGAIVLCSNHPERPAIVLDSCRSYWVKVVTLLPRRE